MEQYLERAHMLVEALPYIQRLFGKTIVIKYGGAAMMHDDLTQKIMEDITLLKFVGMNPILVHGGGPDINHMLDSLDIKPNFVDGLRVTDDATMEVVQMVLTGKINKEIVAKLNGMGASAIGLCGIDGNIIKAVKAPPKNGVDLGNVGQITSINTTLLNTLAHDQYIPVIAPVGTGDHGESYNINADTVAGAIATALKAEKLIFLTDTDGIRTKEDDPESLLYVASKTDILNMIDEGKITGGMLPKVQSCLSAIEKGVGRTHILNGTIPHPIILEIFTDSGIGTMVTG
ncbi:acetylglutamate kinase [Christensenella sp. NSJ-35]|uniref:Acetylglutamate kinase n=2 Tax=Christensenellaceae TaxID=990719 RepID=A0ABR7EIA1_9FIRM|nr:acetylglutamate kinase [Christensenella tenuis]